MITKQASLTLAVITVMGIFSTGCPKACIEANYSFAIQDTVAPEKDSIHVGDTLFLISSTPTKMMDISTGDYIDYANSRGLNNTLAISKLIQGNSFPPGGVKDFDFFQEKGSIYTAPVPDSLGTKQLKYEAMNGKYELKIGIIPKQKGIYALGLGDGISNGLKGDGNCEKATLVITLSNNNTHAYYYEKWQGKPLSEYEIARIYCFKVY